LFTSGSGPSWRSGPSIALVTTLPWEPKVIASIAWFRRGPRSCMVIS
jgi:hypothetical protein